MKIFIDTEFVENGVTIDLISIGLVADDGREYYAISTEFNPNKASQWVIDNVLNSLPPRWVNGSDPGFSPRLMGESMAWKSRDRIKEDIIEFCGESPEFWAEYGSYDWVAFCQLFGKMIDLPKGYPMRIRDVIQKCKDEMGLSSRQLPESLETEGNHNALLGARSVKARYDWLVGLSARDNCGDWTSD